VLGSYWQFVLFVIAQRPHKMPTLDLQARSNRAGLHGMRLAAHENFPGVSMEDFNWKKEESWLRIQEEMSRATRTEEWDWIPRETLMQRCREIFDAAWFEASVDQQFAESDSFKYLWPLIQQHSINVMVAAMQRESHILLLEKMLRDEGIEPPSPRSWGANLTNDN
jgi:hypothetical protein